MAEVPLFVMVNGLLIGNQQIALGFPTWEGSENDAFYRWSLSPSRTTRFTPASIPQIYHYQAVTAASVASITAANPAVLTLANPMLLRSSGDVEVIIQGVTGADAGKVNGPHQGTLTSSTTITLTGLDTSALTFSAASATIRYPAFIDYFGAESTGFANANTDPTYGGQAPSVTWGAELGFLAHIHEEWGDPDGEGKVAYLLKFHSGSSIWARAASVVASVTKGATTTISFAAAHNIVNEASRGRYIVFSGFTGDFAPLNGRHKCYYSSTSAVTVEIDSSAYSGTWSGDAIGALTNRWAPSLDDEVYDDFVNQVRNAVAWLEDQGNTVRVHGLVGSWGYSDANQSITTNTKRTRSIASVSTSGNPTTITTTAAHGLTQPAAASARLLAKVTGITGAASGLNGLHECRVTSTTAVEIDVANTGAATLSAATVEIGDPLYFFRESLDDLIENIRTDIADITGQTETIPTALVIPNADTAATWRGNGAFYSATAFSNIKSGIRGVASLADSILAVDVSDLRKQSTSAIWLSASGDAELGRRCKVALDAIASQRVPANNDGVPVYWFLGESLCAGTIDRLGFFYDGDPNYSGRHTSNRGTLIWNYTTGVFEEYTTNEITGGLPTGPGNSNTHPFLHVLRSVDGTVGSESSLILELKTRHPDEDVYLVKLGVHGSTLQQASIARSITSVETNTLTPLITLDSGEPHNRWQSFQVQFTGMEDAGIDNIEDGVAYTATPVSYTSFRITVSALVSGSYGSGASAVVPSFAWQQSAADLWTQLEETKTAVYAYLRDQGKIPDCRGVFWWQGYNDANLDATNPGLAAGYGTALAEFFPEVRTLLSTRSDPGTEVPIVIAKLRSSDDYPSTIQSAVATVQAAQASVASGDSQIALCDLDSANDADLESNETPISGDGVHLTMRGYIDAGFLLNNSLDSLDIDGAVAVIGGSSGEEFDTV